MELLKFIIFIIHKQSATKVISKFDKFFINLILLMKRLTN